MVPAPGADLDDYVLVHWSYVGLGAPWRHTSLWKPPTEPAFTKPTEPDRITARRVVQIIGNDSRLLALCNDGSIFQLALEEKTHFGSLWLKLPAIPQP